jgi:hypothetical protein
VPPRRHGIRRRSTQFPPTQLSDWFGKNNLFTSGSEQCCGNPHDSRPGGSVSYRSQVSYSRLCKSHTGQVAPAMPNRTTCRECHATPEARSLFHVHRSWRCFAVFGKEHFQLLAKLGKNENSEIDGSSRRVRVWNFRGAQSYDVIFTSPSQKRYWKERSPPQDSDSHV